MVAFYETESILGNLTSAYVCDFQTSGRLSLIQYLSNNLNLQISDTRSSSILGKNRIFLETTHSGLNKFHSLYDKNFQRFCGELIRLVKMGELAERTRGFSK